MTRMKRGYMDIPKVDSGEIDSRAKIRQLEELVGMELEY